MQLWYENNHKTNEKNIFSKMEPNWQKVYFDEDKQNIVYEIELANPDKLMVLSNQDRSIALDNEQDRHVIKLLIFEEKITGKILYSAYMSIESISASFDEIHYKKKPEFSGNILYYHFNGKFSNGWAFENGKVRKRFSAISPSEYEGVKIKDDEYKSTQAVECVTGFAEKYQYQCVGVSGYMNCGYNFIGYEYYTVCQWQEESINPQPLDPLGDPSPYYPPIYFDCSGLQNGQAYIDPECKQCIGGITGFTSCADIKHRLDAYPCAKALVLQMSTLQSDISNLIKNSFAKNDQTNIVLEADARMVGTNTDGANNGVNIFSIGGGGKGYNFFIGLNPDILNNASKEYILVTIYHEALHAYISLKKNTLTEAQFNEQFAGFIVNGGRITGVEDPAHWPMAYNNFINGLRDVVLAFNSSCDPSRAYSLALCGITQLTPAQRTVSIQERNTTVPGYTGTKCP